MKQLESSSDGTIRNLNSKRHKIKITQGQNILEFQTDTKGFFKFEASLNDTVYIVVNEKSPIFSKRFRYVFNEVNYPIKLRISDKKLATYKDSIQAPDFFKKYNEKQAELDFNDGKKRILAGGGFISEESMKRREKLSAKYGIEYDYLFGCIIMRPELRIMNRYNKVMKELTGIKNVW